MRATQKQAGKSRLNRKKKYLSAAVALVLVIFMFVLAFFIAVQKSGGASEEELAEGTTTVPMRTFSEVYALWDQSKGSWEASLKHKYTEPVTVAVKTKAFHGGLTRESWYVTTDEYNDRAGNLRTIYNFCANNWAGARQWLVENEKPGWPYGGVKDAYLAKDWGKPVAMAIAACTLRECAGVPDQLQYMQRAGTLYGSFGREVSNSYVFSCLEGREYDQGYGLIGWTFDALDDFIAFCKASELNPRSLETQLYFMAYQYYASASWHQRYTYLFSYENVEPTLENVQTIARVHTSCVGMGSVPSVVYPAPSNDVARILASWGNKTFPDLVNGASGAYAFLYQAAYNQQPNVADVAESSMYTGEQGTNGPAAGNTQSSAGSASSSGNGGSGSGGKKSGSTGGNKGGSASSGSKGGNSGGSSQGSVSQQPTQPQPETNSPPETPPSGGENTSNDGGGQPSEGDDIYTVTGPNIFE